VGFLGFGKKEIGRVDIPGEETLTLPAGKVDLRYVENREGRELDDAFWRGPADDLEIRVTPMAGGGALEVRRPRGNQEGAGLTIHRKVGILEVPAAGEYVVAASMTVGDEHQVPRIVARA
jgi:hypothetical protein